EPLVSAFHGTSFHFQAQLSDGHLVVALYYDFSNAGMGTFYKLPPRPPEGMPGFYPADRTQAPRMRFLSWTSSPLAQMPFQPRARAAGGLCRAWTTVRTPVGPGTARECAGPATPVPAWAR